jgi:hypothetical protein
LAKRQSLVKRSPYFQARRLRSKFSSFSEVSFQLDEMKTSFEVLRVGFSGSVAISP